nr:hypothetical protein [Tanacetum cinerariifolium]
MIVQAQEEIGEESVANEAVIEDMDDKLARAATIASSLKAEQDSGVNTPQSGKDILKVNELVDLFTNLQNRVLALEATKTTQAQEIDSLKKRVKKLEKKQRIYKDHEEPSESRTTTTISSKKLQDKGKAKMIEEPVKLKKKDQILFDEEVARKLQKEINEEERLVEERARQEEEANIALIETWEDIQAKVDADYQLIERLQAEEQQELNEEEKAKLFMELLEKRSDVCFPSFKFIILEMLIFTKNTTLGMYTHSCIVSL